MRPKTHQFLVVLFSLGLVISACGGDADDTSSEDSEPTADTETEETETADADDETDDEEETDDSEDTDETEDESAESDDEASESTGSANTAEVVAAADALIATLSDDEADTMLYDFGDSTITSGWSNLPACTEEADNAVERAGIQMGNLTDDQQTAVLDLAATVLSDDGLTEFTEVRLADDYLQDTLGNTIWDSDCYSMAIYGTPSETDAFAVQFGGHHYARMATYEGDTVTVTPSFTGIEPGTFESDGTTYDTMGDEMSAMYGIFTALDETQQTTAELGTAPDSIVMGPGSDDPFPDTEGLAVSELSDEQKDLVLAAMSTFVDDFDSSVAETKLATYESELDETTIAWATGIDTETSGAYARIDGPSVWIEVSNEDGATGIHFHGIYRDKDEDYGSAS